MVISVVSAGFNSGNKALITLNDVQIFVEANDSNHYRGLHVVVINPVDGKIVIAKVFDTYKSSEEFELFITNHKPPEDSIVIAACKDECAKNLSKSAKKFFSDMGSMKIDNLKYR